MGTRQIGTGKNVHTASVTDLRLNPQVRVENVAQLVECLPGTHTALH